MALGAPLGIWLENRYGMLAVGEVVTGISRLNIALALPVDIALRSLERSLNGILTAQMESPEFAHFNSVLRSKIHADSWAFNPIWG